MWEGERGEIDDIVGGEVKCLLGRTREAAKRKAGNVEVQDVGAGFVGCVEERRG